MSSVQSHGFVPYRHLRPRWTEHIQSILCNSLSIFFCTHLLRYCCNAASVLTVRLTAIPRRQVSGSAMRQMPCTARINSSMYSAENRASAEILSDINTTHLIGRQITIEVGIGICGDSPGLCWSKHHTVHSHFHTSGVTPNAPVGIKHTHSTVLIAIISHQTNVILLNIHTCTVLKTQAYPLSNTKKALHDQNSHDLRPVVFLINKNSQGAARTVRNFKYYGSQHPAGS